MNNLRNKHRVELETGERKDDRMWYNCLECMTLARKIIAPEETFGGCHLSLACRLDTVPSLITALPVANSIDLIHKVASLQFKFNNIFDG